MTLSQTILSKLWWGPLRRPFEAIARRLWGKQSTIQFGPLKGASFQGGLACTLGIYEIAIQEVIRAQLRPADIFYDIGANYGYISLLASTLVGDRGAVYAFEPLPENIQRIEQVLSANQVQNCHVVSVAISDQTGTALLHFNTDSRATPSLTRDTANLDSVEVATETLDHFIQDHPLPHLIKLDVEGAESMVLKGAAHLLSRPDAPTWVIEIHDEDNDRKVTDILELNQYSINNIIEPRQRVYPKHIIAHKKS
ncbi:MAG: FkbM family methyltransferase [Gemmatimonadetes bacterium]|nr:MAG: FkbM family methyltransferase [Gemmatimonadota bacterium]